MPKHRDARNPGKDLLEQLKAFGYQFRSEEGQPGDIPARPGKTRDQAVLDRGLHGPRDDGDRGGCLLCRASLRGRSRDNQVDLQADELCGEGWEPFGFPVRPAVFNDDVSTLDVASLAQRLPEYVHRHPALRLLRT
jgi:hypothetical protein